MKLFNIAGHGLKQNGTFDPGASGFIKQGEHKYYAESFFNYLKKYQPANTKTVYHTKYNVYDRGNIVDLAREHGSDVAVIEWHFDASSNPDANKGHVIVYSGFKPDALDLRIKNAISKTIGVRYDHKGQKGISGRNNLANCNRCANGGINYRLVELGFGTSPIDSKIMLEQMDLLAKELTEAIYNVEIKEPQQQDSMAGYYVVKKGDTLWGIGQEHNVMVAELKTWNNLKSDLIFPGQSLIVVGADHPEPAPEPKPGSTPKAEPKNEIKVGTWVRVPKNKLYATSTSKSPVKSRELSAQVETINKAWKNELRLIKNGTYQGFAKITDITGGTQQAIRVNIESIARQIIRGIDNNGNKIPTGHANRQKHFNLSNTDYEKVRNRVNELM